ncbi:hypothetical protein [Clostridium sp.]|uniref:hypothetical protein n=1 Tax=Clostridium sp. TaxID=1506 RepID=UPI002904FB21|nr:hypothetical protein [Clostridium sp.]MDU2155959.1 hypothetical protein [Clostridium sp.]
MNKEEKTKYVIYKESTEKDFSDEIKNGSLDGFRLAEYRTEEGQDISYHGSPLYSTIHQFTDLESGKEYQYDDADRFASKNIVFHEIENNKIDLSALKQSEKNNIDELQKEITRLNEQMQNIEKAEVVFNDFIRGSNLFQETNHQIDNAHEPVLNENGDYKMFMNEVDMLKGNINRMCVTDNADELDRMYQTALIRLKNVYQYKESKLEHKKLIHVGYSYALAGESEIKNIDYHSVGQAIYEGQEYDIVVADTFEDSQKFDTIMDTKEEIRKDQLLMYSDINKSINNEDKEGNFMENNKENVEKKEFDAGKKIAIAFSKKQVVSERYVTEKKFNDETQRYEPVLNENGEEKKTKELRVKLPNSSELNQFIFTTTENAFEPHKFDKEGQDLGAIDSMLMVKVYENANYKLTRTPYVLDENGEPALNEAGKRMLDFENQEVIKVSGKDLQREFDSWKNREKEQTQEKKGLNHVQEKGTSSEKTATEPTRKDRERE